MLHRRSGLPKRAAIAAARLSSTARLPLLTEAEALSRWRAALPPATATSILAGYSSLLGGIVTDPALLMVPLDDHGFHRGHAVFDTCNVEDGHAFGLTMHIDRLMSSARKARIIADRDSIEPVELRSIVLQTIAATGRRDGVFVRYWLTAGRGDFSISPKACVGGPSFFCVAHEDTHTAAEPRGLRAAFVDVPVKPPLLAVMKSNNYMLNALVAMHAEAAGAQLGIQVTSEGGRTLLAESSVSTVAIVDERGVLRTPPADAILPSTTWSRAVALAPALVERGILSGCEVNPIAPAEVVRAREILSMGGGWVEPVVELDGQPIGGGQPGPVFRMLDELVRADFRNPLLTDKVPYAS